MLTAISLDYIGRPHEAKRAFETVLRLGPTPRIASWVDIYMLSALVKVGEVGRALWRYEKLVGRLAPDSNHATPQRATAAPPVLPVGVGASDASLWARHAGSGWLWEPRSKRAIRLNLHTQSLESHPSFFHAALQHREAFEHLRARNGVADAAQTPAGRPSAAAGSRKGTEGQVADADEDWVRATLQALQYGQEDCSTARALVVELGRRDGRTGKIGSEIHGFGFGAQMHVLTIALSYAVRTRRVLVMRSQVPSQPPRLLPVRVPSRLWPREGQGGSWDGRLGALLRLVDLRHVLLRQAG